MAIKKIKEWLNDKSQFVVLYRSKENSSIKVVKRIKDDAHFATFEGIKICENNSELFIITAFDEDLITIKYAIGADFNKWNTGTCPINNIVLTDDFKFVKINSL